MEVKFRSMVQLEWTIIFFLLTSYLSIRNLDILIEKNEAMRSVLNFALIEIY